MQKSIGLPWAVCLRLAMQATAAGSFAIASVITEASGNIISSGRNQLFDREESPNALRGSLVSHAELNAIAGLPESHRDDKTTILYATLEPCPMCMGAIAMSSIKSICIATRDPWAGAVELLSTNPYMQRKHIQVSYANRATSDLFFYVNMISQRVLFDAPHAFYSTTEACYPAQYSQIEKLEKDREFMAAFRRGQADVVFDRLRRLI